MGRRLYVFLDEGGNFDFSPSGTRHYSLSCVTMERDFHINADMDDYRYEVIEYGKDIDHFHCADDNAHVRTRVFKIIKAHLSSLRIDSLIVRKCKTVPALQEPSKFYARMIGYLIGYVLKHYDLSRIEDVIVITDALPMKKRREAFRKAIKSNLASVLSGGIKYRVLHHQSRAHFGLQIADYCNWAIFRKWETGDDNHYQTIRTGISSEFDIFEWGTIKYYDDGCP